MLWMKGRQFLKTALLLMQTENRCGRRHSGLVARSGDRKIGGDARWRRTEARIGRRDRCWFRITAKNTCYYLLEKSAGRAGGAR
eukprot:scaffold2636_cov124-Isochrysis_galbana.AAC.4